MTFGHLWILITIYIYFFTEQNRNRAISEPTWTSGRGSAMVCFCQKGQNGLATDGF